MLGTCKLANLLHCQQDRYMCNHLCMRACLWGTLQSWAPQAHTAASKDCPSMLISCKKYCSMAARKVLYCFMEHRQECSPYQAIHAKLHDCKRQTNIKWNTTLAGLGPAWACVCPLHAQRFKRSQSQAILAKDSIKNLAEHHSGGLDQPWWHMRLPSTHSFNQLWWHMLFSPTHIQEQLLDSLVVPFSRNEVTVHCCPDHQDRQVANLCCTPQAGQAAGEILSCTQTPQMKLN